MCSPASMIVTRERVLWSENGDSHELIIQENGLDDTTLSPDFIRVEMVPPKYDYGSPLTRWTMALDQDVLPAWWNKKWAEQECARALRAWARVHIHRRGTRIVSAFGKNTLIVLGGEVTISGQIAGYCLAYDHATLNATGQTGGYCLAYDHATLNATGQTAGHCAVYGNATLNASGQAKDSAAVGG